MGVHYFLQTTWFSMKIIHFPAISIVKPPDFHVSSKNIKDLLFKLTKLHIPLASTPKQSAKTWAVYTSVSRVSHGGIVLGDQEFANEIM